ncbi:MAG: lipopolysaccharide biosynthesis protein [Dysgonomonas sp.]
MASGMKNLAKDTAIYGLSSIVGRFLNWLLVPFYVRVFMEGDNGIITNIQAYVAITFVILTYGMETTFFRYVNKEEENSTTVYSTSLITLATSSLLFLVCCFGFISPISSWMGYSNHHSYILLMALTVAIDAFCCIPFASLRNQKRPIRFASIKILNIFSNIGFNLFFILACPKIYQSSPELISWFYDPGFGIGYVFVSNLLASLLSLLLLTPDYTGFRYRFDPDLLKRMLRYTFPLLILGIAAVVNQTFDKMIFPHLFANKAEADIQLGIYGACAKIAVVMTMFTQAFRYAYEPFIFSQTKDKGKETSYAMAMKYFIIFGLLIFLSVMFYMDIIKHFVTENYFEGIKVVPIIMMAEIFFGIYFNLSLWYKLIDKTYFGAIFSIVGCVLIIGINLIFIPIYGYIACAWASFWGNLIMMTLSYFVGQKHYPIKYEMKTIAFYFVLVLFLYAIGMFIPIDTVWLRLLFRTVLLGIFLFILIKKDLPLSDIPMIGKLVRNKKEK